MNTLPVHTIESAPADSRPILEGAKAGMGFVPNLFGVFAGSPAMLEAYTTLAKLQDTKTAFDETERQVLFLSISALNGCEYCVAAHTTISAGKRVPQDVVDAVRDGNALSDPKLEALRTFATKIVEERGFAGDDAVAAFLAAGYESRHVLEVILAVAFKTLSNFTNHVNGTPLDEAFAKGAWAPAAKV